MKNNITELVFILDRSGSMAGLESDTIGGFNSMIERQKEVEGEVYVSTILFNNKSLIIHDRVKLHEIGPMTRKDYLPQGCTALFDSVGGAIKHIENIHKYIRPEDVSEHTMFVITTDGLENASHEYTGDEIRKLIENKKEKNSWEFIFLGANIDAEGMAEEIGIGAERAVRYRCDSAGTELNYDVICETISDLRTQKHIRSDWKQKIDEDYKNRKSDK